MSHQDNDNNKYPPGFPCFEDEEDINHPHAGTDEASVAESSVAEDVAAEDPAPSQPKGKEKAEEPQPQPQAPTESTTSSSTGKKKAETTRTTTTYRLFDDAHAKVQSSRGPLDWVSLLAQADGAAFSRPTAPAPRRDYASGRLIRPGDPNSSFNKDGSRRYQPLIHAGAPDSHFKKDGSRRLKFFFGSSLPEENPSGKQSKSKPDDPAAPAKPSKKKSDAPVNAPAAAEPSAKAKSKSKAPSSDTPEPSTSQPTPSKSDTSKSDTSKSDTSKSSTSSAHRYPETISLPSHPHPCPVRRPTTSHHYSRWPHPADPTRIYFGSTSYGPIPDRVRSWEMGVGGEECCPDGAPWGEENEGGERLCAVGVHMIREGVIYFLY